MIVTRTPFRITLGGGGTDLPSYYSQHGGFVFAAALDKYMFIHLNHPFVDERIQVRYSRNELVSSPEELQHELAREALRLHGITQSIDLVSMADIPSGTGLGSSSSYLVGLLNALHSYRREYVTVQSLAEEACHIELRILGKNIGKQDQYMAAFGGLTVMDIARDGTVKVRSAQIAPDVVRELESNIMLYYTGLNRSAPDILSEQDGAMKDHRDARHNEVANRLDRIKDIGYRTLEALESGNLDQFAPLMQEHWSYKQSLSSKISNREIDALYHLGMDNGAEGGKLLGAGGGGFLLFYCDKKKDTLDKAMRRAGLKRMFFRFDFEGSKTLVNLFNLREAVPIPATESIRYEVREKPHDESVH